MLYANRLFLLITTIGTSLLAITPSVAADLPAPSEQVGFSDEEWTFTLVPYFWAAGLHGDVRQFGLPEVDIDASFGDIIKHFDIGAMAVAEARHGRFSLFSDFLYLKLGAEKDTPLGILADDVDVDITSLMVTAAAGYSVLSNDRGNFDLIAGARLWSTETQISLNGGLLGDRSVSDDATWVDPLVGVKGRVNLNEDFYLTGWGMIGGFGVSSDLMWDVMGGIGYSFSDRFSVVAGYRALGVDYKNNGFVYDVVQDGPILGGVFRF